MTRSPFSSNILSHGNLRTVCLIVLVCVGIGGLKADDSYYTAAVFEHVRPEDPTLPDMELIKKHLQTYETAAETAALHGADIIVFPEWGLYPGGSTTRSQLISFIEDIPDPKLDLVNPCVEASKFQNRPILTSLSCLARNNGLYVVANVADIKKCITRDAFNSVSCPADDSECPDDGNHFMNTNIVFNRNGTLISRYYKKHLFFEFDTYAPKVLVDNIFQTDFGNFTTFICFDIMFKEPVEVIEKYGIINVAFPTNWVDHAPFLYFAVPFQQAWAMGNKVNLLAANGHNLKTASLGSGIYSADRGALVYTHNPDGRHKLLISKVPKYIENGSSDIVKLDTKKFFIENGEAVEFETEDGQDFKDECEIKNIGRVNGTQKAYRCFSTDIDHYDFVKLERTEDSLEICSNGFCCSLSYKSHSMDEDYFFGVTGKPLDMYHNNLFGTESCFLSRCESFNGHSCGNLRLISKTVFENIELKGNFSKPHVFPYVLNSNVRLTDRLDWSFDGKSQIVYKNSNETSSLLFIGLYGRLFHLDQYLGNFGSFEE